MAAEQFGSKSRRLFSVESIVADGVSSQNFRHWSAEPSSDRLLGSAISHAGHTNRAIDQLRKRLTMVIKAKGGNVEFRLD